MDSLRLNAFARKTLAVMIAAALLPTAALAAGAGLEATVTIKVKGARLVDCLDRLSKMSGVKFIVRPGLERVRVTVSLERLTVREALAALCERYGLTATPLEDGSVVIERKKGTARGLKDGPR